MLDGTLQSVGKFMEDKRAFYRLQTTRLATIWRSGKTSCSRAL